VLYVLLELALGLLALATPTGFGWAEHAYTSLARAGGTAAPWMARAGLVTLVLLPPTFLMGGTLPLFCRQFVAREDAIAAPVGRLYALNTLGGALGCALAGFVLIPVWGIGRAVAFGAALNFAAGLAALASRPPDVKPSPPSPRPAGAPEARRRGWILALALLTGFAALAQEVLWTRFLALVVRNTVYTYTLTLTVVLAGILLGSFAAARGFDRTRARAAWFGALQVATGLSVLLLMSLPASSWNGFRHQSIVFVVLLLVPATLSGASLPLAVRLFVSDPARAGAGFGRVAAMNTLGGILGALATGFALLPRLGLQAGTEVVTAVNVAAGALAWLTLSRPRRRHALAIALAGLAWFAIPRAATTRVPADFLANGAELVDFREGLQSNLAVLRRDGLLSLEIDRWWQGEARKTHQVMAAHLPMLLHPRPRRVLVVGIGAGQTPSRFLMYDLERLDCVDIEPAVFDLVRPHFESRWMADPRVRLIADDGRGFVLHTGRTYDVISLEVGQMFRPGAAAFYTAEFYRRARERLAPGGVISQFVPIPFLSVESFEGIVRTFREVFPNATLWYNTSELLLVGGTGDSIALDRGRLAHALADPGIARDLAFGYWGGPQYWLSRPSTLAGGFLCGPRALAGISRTARVDHDDRPRLDYATARVEEAQLNELPILALLRSHLDPLAGAVRGDPDPALLAAADSVRSRNLGDIAATACLRRVDAARGAGNYGEVLRLAQAALLENVDGLVAERVMGDALVILGRAGEGEPHLRRVVSLRPDDALAHHGLAVAVHGQGRFAEAIEHYRAALALGAETSDTHNNLGAALAEQGDLAAARGQFEEALRLHPGDADALRNLARVTAALGEARRTSGPPH
jgi:spermidine synthase